MNLEKRFTDKEQLTVDELETLVIQLILQRDIIKLKKQINNEYGELSNHCQEHEEIMREITGH